MYISYIYILYIYYILYIFICDMNQVPRLNWRTIKCLPFSPFSVIQSSNSDSIARKERKSDNFPSRKWWTGLPLLLARLVIIAHLKNDQQIPRKSIPSCSCWLKMAFCLVLGKNSPNEWPGFAYPEWVPWCFIGLLGWISILLCLTII